MPKKGTLDTNNIKKNRYRKSRERRTTNYLNKRKT